MAMRHVAGAAVARPAAFDEGQGWIAPERCGGIAARNGGRGPGFRCVHCISPCSIGRRRRERGRGGDGARPAGEGSTGADLAGVGLAGEGLTGVGLADVASDNHLVRIGMSSVFRGWRPPEAHQAVT
ncbi:hypothetical protein BN940_08031 [Castellaniella defragrans 65Phen]|uniref:Uncharacterized protein n=1 Tax=Castellaniella defragrans (strain DSM 12143 / CCUG 39792 / 65Phen) TaxID=1437824 RepID=W8WWW8_CASD6|nr:hypothetical protein BN940_08031 [Castellaniella defragrans 65Phen]